MEQQEQRTIVININLTRGLVAVLIGCLLVVALLGYLAWGREQVAASGSQAPLAASTALRQYYLTKGYLYDGSAADDACDSGYHMASLWEILDTSNLKYNTDKGTALDDSGDGPPAAPLGGWVRTGYISSTVDIAGQANCGNWTSNDDSHYGTFASLNQNWTAVQGIHVWYAGTGICDYPGKVWCVED